MKLEELAPRIERVALDPNEIRAPFARLLRPVLARLGVEPVLKTEKLLLLLDRLRALDDGERLDDGFLEELLDSATKELDANLSSVERACVVNDQPMVTVGGWLRRVYEVLVRAERAIRKKDELARALLARKDPIRLLPPLTVRGEPHEGDEKPDSTTARRVVELELSSVDRLLDAAEEEDDVLGRKRRLLAAARQMLLDANATLPLDAQGTSRRLEHIASRIAYLDRLEAAGLSPDAALTYQLRQAIHRGERDRAYAALCAMQVTAVDRADDRLFAAVRGALGRLGAGEMDGDMSLSRSACEMFGADIDALTRKAYEKARKRYKRLEQHKDIDVRNNALAAAKYFDEACAGQLARAAVAVDGCVDVGGALLPTRVVEHEAIVRAVRHPTKELALLPATVEDVQDAVIDDPRLLVLDLAAGRLLARRYIAHELHTRQKTVMRGEVRAYVLDGSGSMAGPRARMRDAIVTSELVTLRERLLRYAKLAHVVLFYRYFNKQVEPSVRVDSVAAIDTALADVLGTMRTGGTDIEAALLATLDDIARAKTHDPELSKAQIVIVTDGEAPVDADRVSKARETLGDMPIALSVVALGQENEALRSIVARQRAKGERAFYHFIADDVLSRIMGAENDLGPVHAPPVPAGQATPAALAAQIGDLVEELAERRRVRDVEALESLDTRSEAVKEVGLTEEQLSEGELARARALYRDRATLERQFLRWFPEIIPDPLATPGDRDDLDAVIVVLTTIAETIGVTGGTALERMADAIDLLERLMPDARLTPARYRAVLDTKALELVGPMNAVRSFKA